MARTSDREGVLRPAGETLRPCAAPDAGALALVGAATFLDSYAEILPGADILAHCASQHSTALYAAWLARADHAVWLAEAAGGAPVGYVTLNPPDLPVEPGPGDVEIKRIYLLRRYHGAGLGAALLAAAQAGAAARGFERLLLGVYSQNAQAIAFYRRQGFEQVGVRRFQVGANLYDDLVLARPVEAPATGAPPPPAA